MLHKLKIKPPTLVPNQDGYDSCTPSHTACKSTIAAHRFPNRPHNASKVRATSRTVRACPGLEHREQQQGPCWGACSSSHRPFVFRDKICTYTHTAQNIWRWYSCSTSCSGACKLRDGETAYCGVHVRIHSPASRLDVLFY